MEAHSGHYRPSPENFELLIRMLIERGADLSLAKVQTLLNPIFLQPINGSWVVLSLEQVHVNSGTTKDVIKCVL